MPYLKAHSGIRWHYDVEGEGEHLLFIHGWGVDKRIWRQQSKFFSRYYRVMTVDLPGHGKSSWEKATLEHIVRDLKSILEKTGFRDVNVVGSSLGGLVALKLYELFPDGIRRIIFVGAMPKFAKTKDYPHGLDVNRMRTLNAKCLTDYPSIVNVFFRSLFTPHERRSRRVRWIQKFRRRQPGGVPVRRALVEYLDILEQEDLTEVLKGMQIPTQFINGKEDEICTKETVAFLKKLSPQSRFDFFEKCGHFPFLSQPREFNRVMEEFLTQATL